MSTSLSAVSHAVHNPWSIKFLASFFPILDPELQYLLHSIITSIFSAVTLGIQ